MTNLESKAKSQITSKIKNIEFEVLSMWENKTGCGVFVKAKGNSHFVIECFDGKYDLTLVHNHRLGSETEKPKGKKVCLKENTNRFNAVSKEMLKVIDIKQQSTR